MGHNRDWYTSVNQPIITWTNVTETKTKQSINHSQHGTQQGLLIHISQPTHHYMNEHNKDQNQAANISIITGSLNRQSQNNTQASHCVSSKLYTNPALLEINSATCSKFVATGFLHEGNPNFPMGEGGIVYKIHQCSGSSRLGGANLS